MASYLDLLLSQGLGAQLQNVQGPQPQLGGQGLQRPALPGGQGLAMPQAPGLGLQSGLEKVDPWGLMARIEASQLMPGDQPWPANAWQQALQGMQAVPSTMARPQGQTLPQAPAPRIGGGGGAPAPQPRYLQARERRPIPGIGAYLARRT